MKPTETGTLGNDGDGYPLQGKLSSLRLDLEDVDGTGDLTYLEIVFENLASVMEIRCSPMMQPLHGYSLPVLPNFPAYRYLVYPLGRPSIVR